MGCSHEPVLLGDIGATNARFALLSNGALGPIEYFTVAQFPRFADVIKAFLDRDGRPSAVRRAALAVAGPVDRDRCAITNCSWTIDARELRAAFDLRESALCNDFEAAALALPDLTAADLYPLGGGKSAAGAPMAVLGPGTGLGVAAWSLVLAARSSSQPKAVTRPWRPPRRAKMRSSTICAGSSAMCRRSGSFQGRAWKTSTAPSPRSMASMSRTRRRRDHQRGAEQRLPRRQDGA